MKKQKTRFPYTLVTGLIAFVLLFYFYADVLIAPNSFLFDAGGDGIKNYYTYLFHAKYDAGFSEFSGMNYPFYEHIVYTDAHPLLSYLIGKLGLSFYGIGILNYLMLLSYPLAAMVLYKIIRHYGMEVYWAIPGAIMIAFMSPQVFRLTGHYSMSYVFAIPLMWYLLIKAFTIGKWYWTMAISLFLLIFFFTHPYLGIILAFFGIVFWLVTIFMDKDRSLSKRIIRSGTAILIQIALPLILFQGLIAYTDTHLDRLANPAGFFHYYANWKSILVAHDGPLRSLIYAPLDVRIGEWETWAYIGFPTIIFAIVIAVHFFKDKIYRQRKELLRNELVIFVIAAWLTLLFAFCFPLKFDPFRWITDLFGPLKQFRILGRFTWVFFYVFSVAAIVGFHKVYMRKSEPFWPIIYFILLVFYFLEFSPIHERLGNHLTQSSNAFQEDQISADTKEVIETLNEKEYDAFIMLPFQHMSSENIMLLGSEDANKDAFLISFHGHIPMVNSISSRMSFTEAIKANNYFSPAFMEKQLTYDFTEDAKIAVIKNRDELAPYELRMTWESDKILENEQFVLYDFDPKKWNNKSAYDKIKSKNRKAQVQLSDDWRSDTNDVWFLYENFDQNPIIPVKMGFNSPGAYHDYKSSWNIIQTFNLEQIPVGKYTLSLWFALTIDRPDQLAVIEASFGEEKPAEWIAEFDVKQSTVIVDKWCRIEMEFEVKENMEEIKLLLTGNGSGEPFMIDELLIQRQGDPALFKTVSYLNKTWMVYNNYWLSENAFQNQ